MKRWKVLIADDEMIIREGIKESVDWDQLNLNVVADAEDGEEALELAVEHQVDILLADLNMPIMNGLTLIKHLREELPNCKVIIITGHDEFSYAQEALRLSVVDYIIKPVETKELYRVLDEVCQKLMYLENRQQEIEQRSKQLERNVPLLRETFCLQWIKGELSEHEIREQLRFLQLPEVAPKWGGVLRWPEMDINQPLLTEQEKQSILFALEEHVKNEVSKKEAVVVRESITGCIYVCIWDEQDEEPFLTIEQHAEETLKIRIVQRMEAFHGNVSDIPSFMKRCKESLYIQNEVSQIVRGAERYMSTHFHESGLTLETIARELHVSSAYLSRLFKQQVGVSFVHALTKLRMKKAMQLLHSTDLTINEISQQVGYETQHYFSTAFKKVVGVTPNGYRKGKVASSNKS
ncbi:response regulator transcription factor [Alkalihalobacillus hemicellulosilyticus]|uniref:Signal transduction response regulator n=1 Tax=Halalkalibacter hemicellulosilyticusJCM 9152 TaxID=1236971 RepID=W4QKA2_9BACI|nr:response regulator [Halalkalibacter hemicellulosilyticus]GAE32501.1 signal transduction response regulator [Halalkalibacter hemicellulosilyticusJCM 9152]